MHFGKAAQWWQFLEMDTTRHRSITKAVAQGFVK